MTITETIARAIAERRFDGTTKPYPFEAEAQAAITALTQAGYAIVPVEPTETMLQAGADDGAWTGLIAGFGEREREAAHEVYATMIQAGKVGA